MARYAAIGRNNQKITTVESPDKATAKWDLILCLLCRDDLDEYEDWVDSNNYIEEIKS